MLIDAGGNGESYYDSITGDSNSIYVGGLVHTADLTQDGNKEQSVITRIDITTRRTVWMMNYGIGGDKLVMTNALALSPDNTKLAAYFLDVKNTNEIHDGADKSYILTVSTDDGRQLSDAYYLKHDGGGEGEWISSSDGMYWDIYDKVYIVFE